jgi:hypothetical protein
MKPPKLLQITGPMIMSYPVASHVQYRLIESGKGITLTLTHRVIGDIAAEHREKVGKVWQHFLSSIKDRSKKYRQIATAFNESRGRLFTAWGDGRLFMSAWRE